MLHILLPVQIEKTEALLAEFTNRVGLVCSADIVVRLLLLQHEPHHFDVFLGISPVAPRIEVAKKEFILKANLDPGCGAGDLAGDKSLAASGALVIEEDTIGGVQIVGFAVIDSEPVGKDLSAAIGGTGMERCRLDLGNLVHLAKHLGGGGLVKPYVLGQASLSNRLQKPYGAKSRDIAGIFRYVEGDAHMALGAEIVDLVGAKCVEELGQL